MGALLASVLRQTIEDKSIIRNSIMKLSGEEHLIAVFIRNGLRWIGCLVCLLALAVSGWTDAARYTPPEIKVAEGFEVRLAAAPPLVGYPMMACLDDRGRLYVAESDGRNLTTRQAIERELPRFVRRLVDVDGDGVFDKSTIFADRMTMPEGGLWHDGALYICLLYTSPSPRDRG